MNYPEKSSREIWPPFGYESAMLHIAVMHDDAEGFLRFLGDHKKADFFVCSSVVQCAAQHGAINCLEALFKAGIEDSVNTQEEWRDICRNEPPYGPTVTRFPA